MTWYFMKKIRGRPFVYDRGFYKRNNWFIRFCLLFVGYSPIAYQEGIVLINEEGKTRIIWEKIE